MAMDVKRDPAILKRKKIRRTIIWTLVGAVVIVVSAAVMKLKPAAPSVAYNTLWFGVVKRGPMVREVRGAGSLVPEDIRWITATTSGRVHRIVLRPGAPGAAHVKEGTVLVEMTNPDIEQAVKNAKVQMDSAIAQLAKTTVDLDQSILAQRTALSSAQSQEGLAKARLTADLQLKAQGIASDLTVQTDQVAYDAAKSNVEVTQKALDNANNNKDLTLSPQRAAVDIAKAAYETAQRQLDDLHVKSPMNGQLQVLGQNVEEGAQIGAGAQVARVSDPSRLKAQIRISETQTRDLAIGQKASIDTRNGIVKGHVTRIEPAATGGTVGVDVTIDDALPTGARPDQSVDGTIELERLENVLYVEHPTSGTENSTVGLFKVLPNSGESVIGAQQEAGHEAVQSSVKFGRSSVQYMEVVEGLKEGDHVILSDMSQYDGYDRIKISS
jgi:HlyD family secretion protein